MKLTKANSLRLQELLNKYHLTAMELSQKSGVSYSTIIKIIGCEKEGTKDKTLLSICEGLGIELWEYYKSKLFRGSKLSSRKDEVIEKINCEYGSFIGVMRKLDDLGRIVIPMTFREAIGLKCSDKVEILVTTKNEILIRKYEIEEEVENI